jgi:predicted MFS family arabinose efflux permease
MAKPHRMAMVTGLCLVMALGSMMGWEMRGWVSGALSLMVVGIGVTLWRRLNGLSQSLHQRVGGAGK